MSRLLLFALLVILGALLAAPVFAQEDDVASPTVPATSNADMQLGVLLAPKAFRAAAERVRPSIVRIEGFGGVAGSVGAAGVQPPGEGPTTGLVISPDGYILTSTFNFIRKPPVITVVLPDGQRKVAELLGRDETRKICVLKVGGVSNLPVPTFADRDKVKVGQWAVALGVGFGGSEPAPTAGIVSATSRISAKAIQTDANLSPANYGGPLIDIEGRVIGLCVPLSPQSRDEAAGAEWYDSGIGFAVPIAENAERIEALKRGENLHYPFLGIKVKAFGEPPRGVQVEEVVAGSPAEKGGIAKGDIVVAIDQVEPLDPTHFATLVGRHVAGETAKIDFRRGDEQKSVEVELAVMPKDAPKPTKADEPIMPSGENQPQSKPPSPAQPPPSESP